MGSMATIELRGHPTWVKVAKNKRPTLVLLHGGMSSSGSLQRSIGRRLAKDFRIAAFDRRGHGRTADTAAPFHYEDMALETIAFLEWLGTPAHLVGHSDGGIVALLVALRRPDLVKRMVVVGANFHFSGLLPTPPFDYASTQFEQWREKYARTSPDGADHARAIIEKTLTMFATEPTMTTEDLKKIEVPVLVMAGDDEVIDLAHTAALYEALPNSQLAIVPGTSHAVLKERPRESSRLIRRFLRQRQAPETYMPYRRRDDANPSLL